MANVANVSDNYWTTSQVADYLACEPESIYESRRRKEWPGVLGKRRGRQLLFEREAIEQGLERLSDGLEPIPQETTENPTEAILWALEGIHTTLRNIEKSLVAQNHGTFETVGLAIMGDETTTGDDEDE